MPSLLYAWDERAFRFVNEGWSSPLLDRFFSTITDWSHFYFILVPWALYLIVRGGARGRWAVAAVIVGIALADQLSAHLIKDWAARVRPCNALSGVLTPLGKRSSYSFPSSHGATLGAAAVVLTMAYRRWWPLWTAIALSVALSRVYLGLHYPSDVLSGLALGFLVGLAVWWPSKKLLPAVFTPRTGPPSLPAAPAA